MKDYLKLHTNQASYDAWRVSDSYVTPNVSLIEDVHSVVYNPFVSTPAASNS